MWWCPTCKAVRHRAAWIDKEGRRYHCWDSYTSRSDMLAMRKVKVTLEVL